MKPILTNPSYYDVEKGCAFLVTEILKTGTPVDIVVGLTRGGLLPAVIISHLLDKPMLPVSYSSSTGSGDNKNHRNHLPPIYGDFVSGTGKLPVFPKLLIVDDIFDSGNTLNEVWSHYVSLGHKVTTAVLYAKESIDLPHQPTFSWQHIPKDSPWIIFPYEI